MGEREIRTGLKYLDCFGCFGIYTDCLESKNSNVSEKYLKI